MFRRPTKTRLIVWASLVPVVSLAIGYSAQRPRPRDPAASNDYLGALVSSQEDPRPLVRAKMEQAARNPVRGNAEAHLWIAKDLVRRRDALSRDEAEQLEQHLLAVRTSLPDHAEALEMLGRLYVAQGRLAEASPCFERAVPQRPWLALTHANLLQRLGQPQAAAQAAAAGVRALRPQLVKDPEKGDHYLALADLLVFCGQYEAAAETLADGRRYCAPEPLFHSRLNLYLTWYDSLAVTDAELVDQRFELLLQAFRLSPSEARVQLRLAGFSIEPHSRSRDARPLLETSLACGEAAPGVYFLLGSDALEQGHVQLAVHQLELAFHEDDPAVLNNLACALAARSEEDLPRAEQLIERAVALVPQHPELRESRAQIRARLGRSQEAIADFEFALRSLPGRPEVHQMLAELYGGLEQKEIAAHHEQLAREAEAAAELRANSGHGL